MPLSDGTIAYFPFAVVTALGVIARMGQAEFSLIGAQAVDAGESVISPIPEPISGVLVAAIGPEVSDETHYWNGAEFQEYPARPSEHAIWGGEDWVDRPAQPNGYCVWDGDDWIDTRSEGDYLGALHQARVDAEIPPMEMLRRLAEGGPGRPSAFGMSEIANHLFPPTLEEFLGPARFTVEEHDLIKGGIRTWPLIPRTHELLHGPVHPDDPGTGMADFSTWLASERFVTLTPADWDQVFDVAVPPPLYSAS